VTVRDPRTAVFWFGRRSPEQFYTAAARLRIVPAHLLAKVPPAQLRESAFARRPVGSGPFRFAAWDPQRRLEIVADAANPRGRPHLDRVVWTVAPDPAAALALLLTGAADVFEAVRPEHLPAIARRPELTTVAYPGLQYGFLVFNVRGDATAARGRAPLFGDRALRRALAQALDRRAMVRNVFDTLAGVPVGPVTRAQAFADTGAGQLPFDPAAARRTLDSLGWRTTSAGGARSRDGRPLTFTISVPRSSETRARFAVLIQEQLRAVGVAARVEPLEFTAFMDRLTHRRFDAAISAWTLDNPSPWGVQELWGSAAARAPGGPNLGGYEGIAFDATLDSARRATTAADARPLLARAIRTINDDAPAVWLFEPRPLLAVHRRLRVVGMRAGAWWAGLADWEVEPARRIARDGAAPPPATASRAGAP
jgi:peptide/nickel transport system substrate-binding protein